MKSDRKRSIVKSPLRLQPHRVLRSAATTPIRTPSGSAFPFGEMRTPNHAGSEYSTMSCEFNALEKIVQDELGRTCSNGAMLLGSASLFERGKLYDEYCAKRNERLKRKLRGSVMAAAEAEDEPRSGYTFETTTTKKKMMKESTTVKRSAAAGLVDRCEHPRYALRSIKKPPLPVPMSMYMAMAVKTESSTGFNGGGRGRKTRPRRN